jgi:hypothetical protein
VRRILADGHPSTRKAVNEDVRSMPWETGIRCPFPYYVERPVVDSCSVLFSSLRRHLPR